MVIALRKPEIALKRAGELIAVGQDSTALQTLYEFFTARKPRGFNIDSYEDLLSKFAELAVEQRKGAMLKDGLQFYRNASQNTAVEAFENIVRKVFILTEGKVMSAQKKSDKASLELIEDLDESETPESILLSVVSSEQTKDRTERAIVTPWLKFIWETYRNVLDILRNNANFLKLYQEISRKAIAFCLTYQRKTEFKRLCELLRNHLQMIFKYSQNQYIDIKNREVVRLYLDTRFVLLNAAADMDLWSEAFRITEDINNLFVQSRTLVSPPLVAAYYEKLTRIMLRSNNPLFLAAAWHCYFGFIKDQSKAVGEAEIKRAANNTLLSTLSVPIIRSSSRVLLAEENENKNRTQRLTNLLRLSSPPTRASLIANLATLDIFNYADPDLRPLYELLEQKFHPLSICKKLAPILKNQLIPNEQLEKYIPLLYNVTLTRLVQQLSQVYSTVRLDVLYKLAVFDDPYKMTSIDIERFIVNGTRRGEFQLRIDHQRGIILFDVDPFDSARPEDSGAQLQASPAELMRLQLTSIATSLYNVQRVVSKKSSEGMKSSLESAVEHAMSNMNEERNVSIARKEYIESKRKLIEPLVAQNIQEEAKRKELLRKQEEEAKLRLLEEQKARELEEALAKEREKIRKEENKRIAESLKEKSGIEILPEELEKMNTDKLLQLQLEQLEKEEQALRTKQKNASRYLDHLVRAYHKEEMPLLHKDFENQQAADLQNYENSYKATVETSKAKHDFDLSVKHRLSRILDDYFVAKDLLNSKNAKKLYRKYKEELKERQAKEEKRRLEQEAQAKAEEERQKRMQEEKVRLLEEAKKAQLEAEAKKPNVYVPPSRRQKTGTESIASQVPSYAQTTRTPGTEFKEASPSIPVVSRQEVKTNEPPVLSPKPQSTEKSDVFVPSFKSSARDSINSPKPNTGSQYSKPSSYEPFSQNRSSPTPRSDAFSSYRKNYSGSPSPSYNSPRGSSGAAPSSTSQSRYVPPYMKSSGFGDRGSKFGNSPNLSRGSENPDFKNTRSFPTLGSQPSMSTNARATPEQDKPATKSTNAYSVLENIEERAEKTSAPWGSRSKQ
ncbi:hypothetical protein BB560_002065 [Smittium megazygosporum]|uniref:PCI domain-containing protein n=1 Tax=Smittium megazygosporum TaxID=133381 RepID=A0A2T9ZFS1_9FUNG|nr:hypothetical protein BB560_002065 [Smittium megazygosporum]